MELVLINLITLLVLDIVRLQHPINCKANTILVNNML